MPHQGQRLHQTLCAAIAAASASAWMSCPYLGAATALAQDAAVPPVETLCAEAALARVTTYEVSSGETLEIVAATNNLLPATLLGMNPGVQPGPLASGTTLRVPPFNGIEVEVPMGQTWQEIAATYRIRADILFEVNGCPMAVPDRIFVPGINWFPGVERVATVSGGDQQDSAADTDPLAEYPLANTAAIISNFGWQPHPERDELVFSSGLILRTERNTAVLAAGEGTVAYAGEEAGLGTLIVINHAQGLQTRYAHIHGLQIRTGDRVSAGQTIAVTSTETAETSTLYFEVRTNSALGWVARDPGDYIPALAVR